MALAFLIAESLDAARRAAVIDYGWAPTVRGWRRPDGLEVHYCASPDATKGLARGTVFFTGPGWACSPALGPDRRALPEMRQRYRFLSPLSEVKP